MKKSSEAALKQKSPRKHVKAHGNKGNTNAKKDNNFDRRLNIRCNSNDKEKWVKQAQRDGLNLQEFVNKALNSTIDDD